MDGLSSLAKSATTVFFGTLIGQALGLLSEIVIIRLAGPQLLGRLGLAYAIVSTLTVIALVGLPSGVARDISTQSNKSATDTLSSGYLISLVITVTLAVCLVISSNFIDQMTEGTKISNLLPLFIPYLIINPFAQISFSGLRGLEKTTTATLSRWILPRVIAFPALVIAFVFFGWETAPVLYWVLVPAVTFISSIFSLKYYGVDAAVLPERETMRRLWRFSWPLAVSASLTFFLSRLDILVLGLYVDSIEIGYYRSIQPLREIATFVSGSFGFLFLPLATRYYDSKDFQSLSGLYRVSTKWITSLTLPLVLVFVLYSRSVISAFLGPSYTDASLALSVLIGGLFVRALVGLDTDLLKAVDRTRIELICAFAGVLCNLLLNFALIPKFGIVGAAVATVASFAVYNLLEVGFIYRLVGTHPFTKNIIAPLVPTVVVAVIISSLIRGRISLPFLVGIGLLYSFTHFLSLLFTRSFEQDDLILLEQVESKVNRKIPLVRRFI